MLLTSPAQPCLLSLHFPTFKQSSVVCASQLRRHSRKYSQVTGTGAITGSSIRSSPINPINIKPKDAVEYLRKLFPPLEFPEDVARRMTTHVSWQRGVEGHNTRLGFIGRRVLHTSLLLFLHECTLLPPHHLKQNPSRDIDRLRPSSFSAGGPIRPLTQTYEEISERLLDTYVLGEHVGGAWQLERIMRWTPALTQVDTQKAQEAKTILHSSGLYKIRGATVEGVMGGIFHQFGGSIAHRVFHTRVLPHIYAFGLPPTMHEKMFEVLKRFGGKNGLVMHELSPLNTQQSQPRPAAMDDADLFGPEDEEGVLEDGPDVLPRTKIGSNGVHVDYARQELRADERQRLGFVG